MQTRRGAGTDSGSSVVVTEKQRRKTNHFS